MDMKPVKNRSLKLNAVMNAILTVAGMLFSLVTFSYVSRVIGPGGTGRVTFVFSIVTYFTMFAQLGIPTYGIRACAKVRDDHVKLSRTAQELLIINIATTILAYVILAAAVFAIPKLGAHKMVFLIAANVIWLSAVGMEWLFKALEQYSYITIRSVLFKFIAVIAMVALVRDDGDDLFYAVVVVIGGHLSFLCNLFYARKYITLQPLSECRFREHMKPVFVFFAMSCAATIYTYLDTAMLGFMKTDVDVGYYHAATRIKTLLVGLVTSLGAVLLPRFSYYVEHKMMRQFMRGASRALYFVFFISIPFTIFFILFAGGGIRILSGDKFDGAILPMQIIMPTLILIGITNVLGIQMLIPMGKERIVLYSEIAGAVTDVVLNLLLIPAYASSGAAIGTLVAEFVVLIVQAAAMKTELLELFGNFRIYKILAGTAAATAVSLMISRLSDNVFVSFILTGISFFGIYALVLLLLKEEMLLEVVRSVKSGCSF